jgi:hypothetical protein
MRYSRMAFVAAIFAGSVVQAQCPPSPLIINLEGAARVHTTSILSPVSFDIFDRGSRDQVAWADPAHEEGFVWLDLNHNGNVDSGGELFGNFTMLSSGQHASNGFEALAEYDTRSLGGNGDGEITSDDFIWDFLKIWIDRNHDGIAQRKEQYSLPALGVEAIGLRYLKNSPETWLDGHGNIHAYVAAAVRRRHDVHGPKQREVIWVEDVYLRVRPPS